MSTPNDLPKTSVPASAEIISSPISSEISSSSVSAGITPSTWSLPIFMTEENKYPLGIILFALATILYFISNHFPLFEPQLLPLTWIDLSTPFIPGTIWLYISDYIFFVVIYISCRDLVNLNKYFYSLLFLQVTSVLIFSVWPTLMPRELFPVPEDLWPIHSYAIELLRTADAPNNCCPSLHVSGVYLSCFIFLDGQKKLFYLFFIWGSLIAISTLTIKQHYFIDVIAGVLMAIISYLIFHRWMPYRQLAKD